MRRFIEHIIISPYQRDLTHLSRLLLLIIISQLLVDLTYASVDGIRTTILWLMFILLNLTGLCSLAKTTITRESKISKMFITMRAVLYPSSKVQGCLGMTFT